MPVEESARIHTETLVRAECHQVTIPAGGDGALRGQSGNLGRPRGHPAGDVSESEPARPRVRPYNWQRELDRGDAAPGRGEVAILGALELRRAGRVIRGHAVDGARAQRPPEQFAACAAPDGWTALVLITAGPHLLCGERELV